MMTDAEIERARERLPRCELGYSEEEGCEIVLLDGEEVYLAHDLLERLTMAVEDELQLSLVEIEEDLPFSDFWVIWPKRVARKDALQVWGNMSAADRRAALDAVPYHLALWQAEGRGTKMYPHPATWLRGRRWEDEISYRPDLSAGQQRQVDARARMRAAVRGGNDGGPSEIGAG